MTTTPAPTAPRVVVALDMPSAADALAFATQVSPAQCRLKVGFELFTAAGPALVEQLVKNGFGVFLDLKFHDIPNTVARACAAAAGLGVWMINVHALGGRRMMGAAREAVDRQSQRPLLIGVTILTSHAASELAEIGLSSAPDEQVQRLAGLARESGLDGVVCSAQEVAALRTAHGPGFCLVTPGIRPAGSAQNDQQRIVTPAEAVRAGAHYLVIGRPITQAADPLAVLESVNRELALA